MTWYWYDLLILSSSSSVCTTLWLVTTVFLRLWLLMNTATFSSVLSYWLTCPSSLQLLTSCCCFSLDFFSTRKSVLILLPCSSTVTPLFHLASPVQQYSPSSKSQIIFSCISNPWSFASRTSTNWNTSSINEVQQEVPGWCRMHTFYIFNIFIACANFSISTIATSCHLCLHHTSWKGKSEKSLQNSLFCWFQLFCLLIPTMCSLDFPSCLQKHRRLCPELKRKKIQSTEKWWIMGQ